MGDQETGEFEVVSAGEEFFEAKAKGLTDFPESNVEWRLVFLGVTPGVLRIGYREFVDNSIRGSFSLELTFETSSRYFTVMGERFEFSRADNEGLAIRHLREQPLGTS